VPSAVDVLLYWIVLLVEDAELVAEVLPNDKLEGAEYWNVAFCK